MKMLSTSRSLICPRLSLGISEMFIDKARPHSVYSSHSSEDVHSACHMTESVYLSVSAISDRTRQSCGPLRLTSDGQIQLLIFDSSLKHYFERVRSKNIGYRDFRQCQVCHGYSRLPISIVCLHENPPEAPYLFVMESTTLPFDRFLSSLPEGVHILLCGVFLSCQI